MMKLAVRFLRVREFSVNGEKAVTAAADLRVSP